MIRVHRITYEKAPERGWGDIESTPNLHFKPTHLKLNHLETSFVLYGERGIFVGNFPALLQNFKHKREDQQDLEKAPSDMDIECLCVAQNEMEDNQAQTVI